MYKAEGCLEEWERVKGRKGERVKRGKGEKVKR